MPYTLVTPNCDWRTSVQPAGDPVIVSGLETRPCAIDAIITSPSTTPAGLLIVMLAVALMFESLGRTWIGFESCTVSVHVSGAVMGLSATVMVTPTAAPSFVAILSPVPPAAPSASWLISMSTFVDAPLVQPLESSTSVIPAGGAHVTQFAVV